MSRFTNSFSEETWFQKYKFGDDNTVEDTWRRVAKDLASIEEDQEKWEEEFYSILEDFKFVPGGRITSNAGTGLKGTTYINCFLPGTQVLTSNGYKAIEEVLINDKVLTHTGKWKKVVNQLKTYHENVIIDNYKDSTLVNGGFSCTENHKLWNSNKTWVESHDNEEVVFLTRDWSDNIINEIDTAIGKIELNTSFMYFLGRFVGDGCTFKHHKDIDSFNIVFSDKEEAELQEIKKYLDETFALATNINRSNQFNGSYIRKCNKPFALLLKEWCGDNCYNKKVPSFIWETSKENIESFLLGLFDADGTVTKKGEVRLVVTSKQLVKDVSALLWMIGIPNRLNTEMQKLKLSTIEPNKVWFHSKNGLKFLSKMKKHYEDDRINKLLNKDYVNNGLKPCFERNGCLITECKEDSFNYEGYVYNISVEDDNSYIVSNVKVKNCFVDGFQGKDLDSIEGIYDALLRQAKILKSEGGYGFCADVMRPCGAHIHGIANQSPGAVKFLELWDKSSEIITAGSNKKSRKDQKNFIRKGAQMVTMSCWHPDILDYIEAKKTPGRLSKFNMSVLCTDDFMHAVDNDLPWKLVFPNYEAYPIHYKKEWNGDLNHWLSLFNEEVDGEDPLVVYHEFKSARDLWNLIMDNTYNRNEPGVLFVDNMNKMNNLYYCEHINATNPCGEQVLPIGGVCLLGSVNLVHFIDPESVDWKYDELRNTIHTAVRFMDNVNDKTHVPLKSQKENLLNKRRIGLGVLGYGSALLMARVRYGSKKALELTEKLMTFFTNEAYSASVSLSHEKGCFPLFDEEKYLQSQFVSKLSEEVKEQIKKYGIRNSHVTSIQPTGNSSCYANLVSGGLEPLFMFGYFRTSIQPVAPEGLDVPRNVDWSGKKFDSKTEWKWIKEGDEDLLATSFEGKTWKFDRSRGLLKEEWIEDYGVSYLRERDLWDEKADWAACTMDLDVDAHVNTMSIFAQWVDSAISKTINLPNDYPYEDFKEVYKKAWNNGIKGFTTYRAGTMTAVLSESSSLNNEDNENKIQKTNAPERPKKLPCDVYHIKVKGTEYFVLVGLLEGDPYEVFAGKNGFIDKQVKSGFITKLGRPKGVYKAVLEDGLELSPINQTCTEEEDALTRMASTALRHGADIHMIVQQLEKVKGDMHSFAKSMARALKKYIPDGVKEEGTCPECNGAECLVRQEGCVTCISCGWSKCI